MKGESAQVTIDYIAGIGIFLLSVFFVFQFMSGLFIPFQSGSDKATLSADRAGTVIVERLLRSNNSGDLNVIDQGKLYYFNNSKLNYNDQANYTNTLREIGLFSNETYFDLNMSVTYPDGTMMNQSGPQLPETTDIGQTKRIVLIVNSSTGYNQTAIISVRAW